MISIAVFGILLSMGKNFSSFNYLIYDIFPGYSKFRSVTMTLVIPLFVMPLLGFIGLEKLLSSELDKKDQKKLWISFAIAGGFALLAFLLAGLGSYRGLSDAQLPDWFLSALKEDRKSILRTDAIRSFLFIGMTVGIIWFYTRKKISLQISSLIIVLLVLLDLWMVDKRYVNEDNFVRNPERTYFSPTDADNAILEANPEKSRVVYLPNPWNESRTSYHHHSIGGYHGAKMGRYQELIDQVLANEVSSAISSLQNSSLDFRNLNAMNMLDTRYMIAGAQANAVIPNPNALGKAWFVSSVKKVSSADEELAAIPSTNTRTTAILDESRFSISQDAYSGSGSIQQTSYSPNKLSYTANVSAKGLAVFSEIYYPKGWIATVDGQEVDILRANYVLRALELEPGQHEIVFEFRPASYYTGNTIMMIFGSILILVFVGSIFLSLREKS